MKGQRGLIELDEEEVKETIEDSENIPEKVEETPVLEVKVVNQQLRQDSPYDGHDDEEYEDLNITEKQKKEFEHGDT